MANPEVGLGFARDVAGTGSRDFRKVSGAYR
jgi:hypothetical protein